MSAANRRHTVSDTNETIIKKEVSARYVALGVLSFTLGIIFSVPYIIASIIMNIIIVGDYSIYALAVLLISIYAFMRVSLVKITAITSSSTADSDNSESTIEIPECNTDDINDIDNSNTTNSDLANTNEAEQDV